MACEVCDSTVQNLGLATSGARVFWCPRCGSLKTESENFSETEKPSLVKRIEDLALIPTDDGILVTVPQWRDIDEACGLWKQIR